MAAQESSAPAPIPLPNFPASDAEAQERFQKTRSEDPFPEIPSALLNSADLLEYIARLAWRTVVLGAPADGLAKYVAEHHYQRKHGPKATYGQRVSGSD